MKFKTGKVVLLLSLLVLMFSGCLNQAQKQEESKSVTEKVKNGGRAESPYQTTITTGSICIVGTATDWKFVQMDLVSDYTWSTKATFKNASFEAFKLTVGAAWTTNYGDNDQDGIGDLNGKDIIVVPGNTYNITFNEISKKYTVIKVDTTTFAAVYPQMFIKGSFNNWKNADYMEHVADYTWKSRFRTTNTTYEAIKFDVYGDWSFAYGIGEVAGKVVLGGSGDIMLEKNTEYDVVFNDKTGDYTVSKIASTQFGAKFSQIYIKGTINGWGTTEDIKMNLVADNTWKVTLKSGNTTGEAFKLDIYGNWAVSYGSGDVADQLFLNGANIALDQNSEYIFTFYDISKKYTLEKTSTFKYASTYSHMFVMGSCNNWLPTDEMELVGDYTWKKTVTFPAIVAKNEFKFDVTGKWDISFGDNEGDGKAERGSLANIQVPTGGENVITFNDKTMEYTVTPVAPKKYDATVSYTFKGGVSLDMFGLVVNVSKSGIAVTSQAINPRANTNYFSLEAGTYTVSVDQKINDYVYKGSTNLTVSAISSSATFEVVATVIPSLSGTYTWPTGGNAASNEDVWLNTVVKNYSKTLKITAEYAINGVTKSAIMEEDGLMVSGKQMMHVKLGKLGAGTKFTYVVAAYNDKGEKVALDDNAGKGYPVTIKAPIITNAYTWPLGGVAAATDDIWVNCDTTKNLGTAKPTVIYTVNGTTKTAVMVEEAVNTTYYTQNGYGYWHVNLGKYEAGTVISYVISIIDEAGNALVTNNNSGNNFVVKIAPPELSGTYTWPLGGTANPTDDVWVNTKTKNYTTAQSIVVAYTIVGTDKEVVLPLEVDGMENGLQKWHAKLGKFDAGTKLYYVIRIANKAGVVIAQDDNKGAKYPVSVGAVELSGTYTWPLGGIASPSDDIWVNTKVKNYSKDQQINVIYEVNTVTKTAILTDDGIENGLQKMHANLGKYAYSTKISYVINVVNKDGRIVAIDDNAGKKYQIAVKTPYLGGTYSWPLVGQETSTQDIWINTTTKNFDISLGYKIAVTGNFVSGTVTGESITVFGEMTPDGVSGDLQKWHVNLGKFRNGTLFKYSIAIIDRVGNNVVVDDNAGKNFTIAVQERSNIELTGTYAWPFGGVASTSDDVWINTKTKGTIDKTLKKVMVAYRTADMAADAYKYAEMTEDGMDGLYQKWHVNLGKQKEGDKISFYALVGVMGGAVEVRDSLVQSIQIKSKQIYAQVYFRGTFNNWGTTAMKYVGNNVWETVSNVKVTNTTTDRFKVDVKGNWTESYPQQDLYYKEGTGEYKIIFNEITKEVKAVKIVL